MSNFVDPTCRAFKPNQRVKTLPHTDAWMKGDRYGTVERIGRLYVHVRMDVSNKVRRFQPSAIVKV